MTRFILAALLLLPTALSGCTGTLDIWGINVVIPGQDDDDDDTGPPGLDFTVYDGTEWLNIDWTEQAEAEGRRDCKATWEAEGVETTEDDQDLCAVCDHIWLITYSFDEPGGGPDVGCLDGTGVPEVAEYERRLGLRHLGGGEFVVYRNQFRPAAPLGDSADDELVRVGVGAFKGSHYTWNGVEEPTAVPGQEYSFYFSGEGDF